MEILVTTELTRCFGDSVAVDVDGFTLTVEAGEVFGLLVLCAGWIYPRIAV